MLPGKVVGHFFVFSLLFVFLKSVKAGYGEV